MPVFCRECTVNDQTCKKFFVKFCAGNVLLERPIEFDSFLFELHQVDNGYSMGNQSPYL